MNWSWAVAVKLPGLLWLCCLPLHQLRLTSGYGFRVHPVEHRVMLHAGIDLAAHTDTVFAVLSGKVYCNYDERLGLFVRLRHGGQVETIYGHLSQWLALTGDTVSAGQPIGITGAPGRVTGEHLHFAVSFNHHYIDPLLFLRRMVISFTNPKKQFDEPTNQPADRRTADR